MCDSLPDAALSVRLPLTQSELKELRDKGKVNTKERIDLFFSIYIKILPSLFCEKWKFFFFFFSHSSFLFSVEHFLFLFIKLFHSKVGDASHSSDSEIPVTFCIGVFEVWAEAENEEVYGK